MTRNSAVSCWLCVEYATSIFFCVLYPLHYIVTFGNNTNVVKVIMVKVVKLDFWKYFSRLKIVYINNILFIYTIFRTFFPSENEFDRNDHDRIWPRLCVAFWQLSWQNKSFCVIVILCHFRFWKRKVLYIINKYLYLFII